LKERIIQGMPSRFEMDHPAKCPGAIHKHLNWDKRTQDDRARYRFIMKQLDPDDPTACDLEKFRKEK
jgi:NMD protein affecting ribosome stability and mRNA decay